MRTFEIIIVLALVAWIAWPLVFGKRRPWGHLTAGVAVVAMVASIAVEGYRWQMIPLFFVTLFIGALAVWDLVDAARPDPQRSSRQMLVTLAMLALIGLITLPPAMLPVFSLPEPTGPYPVGAVTIDLVDTSRIEAYGPSPGGPRRLTVKIWYPADTRGDGPLVDHPEELAPAIAHYLGLPGFFFDHAALVRSNTVPGVQLAAATDPFPTLIYSHGWAGFAEINTNQNEALASRGYVVAAINHTYGAVTTVLGDGVVAALDPAALPDEADPGYAEATEQLVGTFAADISFVMDELERLAEPGGSKGVTRFAGRIDTSTFGVFGHSTGGGGAVLSCFRDTRCGAIFGQDPWVEPVPGEVLSLGLSVPYLAMRSEEWTNVDNEIPLATLLRNSSGPTYKAAIEGAGHRDFTMTPLFSPISGLLGLKGSIASDTVVAIIDEYQIAFFDAFVGKTGRTFPGGLSQFDEVTFEVEG